MSLGALGESIYSRSEVQEIVARYKALCQRAADALEAEAIEQETHFWDHLIVELREAGK